MKITTALAIALGLGALAACNNQAQNNAAENLEVNADNMGGTMDMNATENVDMNAPSTDMNDMNMGDNNTVTNNGY